MRVVSRYMPVFIQEKTSLKEKIIGYFFLILLVGWIVYAIWMNPKIGLSLLVLFIVMHFIFEKYNNNRLKKLAFNRKNENIGTFARSFEYRKIDTWVIRAVYEEISHYMEFKEGICPVKSSDRLRDILNGEEEDLEDIIEIVLQRTKRTDKDIEKNPYYQKLETVKDLVLLLDDQAKIL